MEAGQGQRRVKRLSTGQVPGAYRAMSRWRLRTTPWAAIDAYLIVVNAGY
jgi:hypothetical protein